MKKKIIAFIIAASAFSLFAVDFGGVLTNSSTLKNAQEGSSLKLNQKNSLTLWLKLSFDQTNSKSLAVQGKYQFEGDFVQKQNYNALNLDIFKFTLKKQNCTLTAGRFFYADSSSLIYTQNGDGIKADYVSPNFELSAYAFYTGLLNSHFTTILDFQKEQNKSKLYDLCPDYFTAGVKAVFPYLFYEQTLSAECLSAFRTSLNTDSRTYLELSLSGPLPLENIFYNANTAFLLRKTDSFSVSNLTNLSLLYFLPFKSSVVSLNCVYASGENGIFKPFTGFTSQTAIKSLFEMEYSSLLKTGISFSIKPAEKLLAKLSADIALSAENSISYAGTQTALNLMWQPLSDIFIGADCSLYFSKNKDQDKTELSLKAGINF